MTFGDSCEIGMDLSLAEQMPQSSLGAICLIAAPFIGAGGWESDDIEPRSDLAARLPRDVPIFLYHGRDDDTVPNPSGGDA